MDLSEGGVIIPVKFFALKELRLFLILFFLIIFIYFNVNYNYKLKIELTILFDIYIIKWQMHSEFKDNLVE